MAGDFEVEPIDVGDTRLMANVAITLEERQRGLMEVEELPRGMDGMLFVFEVPRPASFHMLNTPMPLDIWWFDEAGVLIGSDEMEPCRTETCPSYASPGIVAWALETPLGAYDFQPGDVLSTG